MPTDVKKLHDQCSNGEICAICGQKLTAEKFKFLRPLSASSIWYYSCSNQACMDAVKKMPDWSHLAPENGPLFKILKDVFLRVTHI